MELLREQEHELTGQIQKLERIKGMVQPRLEHTAQGICIGKERIWTADCPEENIFLGPALPEDCELICVGTNALATGAMLRAGRAKGATGENAVIYNVARADLILGPIGVMIANGILGEVSPAMAAAVSGCEAVKILIPSSTCGIHVAGTEDCRMEEYLQRAVELALKELA